MTRRVREFQSSADAVLSLSPSRLAAWTLRPDADLSFDTVHTFCGFHVEVR